MSQLVTALVLALQTMLPSIDADRIKSVTNDVFAVVKQEASSKRGLQLEHDTAVAMLTSVIINESGMRESVETCKITGDGGLSIGLGQVMRGPNWEGHSKKEICSNRKLQLTLALHVLDRCWAGSTRADSTFRCYTSGSSAMKSAAADKELKTYLKIKSVLATAKSKSPATKK